MRTSARVAPSFCTVAATMTLPATQREETVVDTVTAGTRVTVTV